MGATSYWVPTLEWYQSATIVWPSGFSDGQSTVMAFSRIAWVRASSPVTRSYASWIVCCAPATSEAWSPPLMSTMALAVEARSRASASVRFAGCARRAAASLCLSRLARFSAVEMAEMYQVRPSDVRPVSIIMIRSLAASRRWKYSTDCSYVASSKSAPGRKPSTDSGVGIDCPESAEPRALTAGRPAEMDPTFSVASDRSLHDHPRSGVSAGPKDNHLSTDRTPPDSADHERHAAPVHRPDEEEVQAPHGRLVEDGRAQGDESWTIGFQMIRHDEP